MSAAFQGVVASADDEDDQHLGAQGFNEPAGLKQFLVALARYSCTKSSVALRSTIQVMMKKLVTSPVNADTALATRRMTTSGFLKRVRYCNSSDFCCPSRNTFGPNLASCAFASAPDKPVACVARSAVPSGSGSSHQAWRVESIGIAISPGQSDPQNEITPIVVPKKAPTRGAWKNLSNERLCGFFRVRRSRGSCF